MTSNLARPSGISVDLRVVLPFESAAHRTVLPELERVIERARAAGATVTLRTDLDALDHELAHLDGRITAAELKAGTGTLPPEIVELRRRIDSARGVSRFLRKVQPQ